MWSTGAFCQRPLLSVRLQSPTHADKATPPSIRIALRASILNTTSARQQLALAVIVSTCQPPIARPLRSRSTRRVSLSSGRGRRFGCFTTITEVWLASWGHTVGGANARTKRETHAKLVCERTTTVKNIRQCHCRSTHPLCGRSAECRGLKACPGRGTALTSPARCTTRDQRVIPGLQGNRRTRQFC